VSRLEIVLPAKVQRIKQVEESAPENESDHHGAGYQAGYEQGLLQAKWEMKRQRDGEAKDARRHIQKLESLHADFEKLVGEQLPDLIHGALDRVFRKHRFTPEEVSDEVSALMHDMAQAGRVSLECSPVDQVPLGELLRAHQNPAEPARFTIQGNPALKPGEFLLKSDLGNVDGRQLMRVRQITDALGL
jgi:flagellar biosynthesis/type III secretory pathway protein FliH